MTEDNALLRRIDREKAARKEAEKLLENKSRELYDRNEELRRARESLEIQVKDRTHELRQAVEKLEEEAARRKDIEGELRKSRDSAVALAKMKSEFLALMSHEIRTPLNAVIGMTDVVLNSRLTEDQKYKLGIVSDSGQMLLRIINDILDLSKIDAGKMQLEYDMVSLKSVIEQCISLVRLEAEKKEIVFEVTSQHNMPQHFYIDGGRLQQILINLVSNVVKHSDAGIASVKSTLVPVSGESGTVPSGLVSLLEEQDLALYKLRIIVSDTGRGIQSADLENLFEPFINLNTTSVGSTGLGLSICKRLCELMGGSIKVESTYGQGSTFTVELLCGAQPAGSAAASKTIRGVKAALVADGATMAAEATSAGNSNSVGKDKPLSILLADDFEVNRLVQLAQLEQLGYRADVVANGEEVLRALKVKNYDVVLMDIRMPVLDGVTTTKRIRQNSKMPQPFIIAVTASALVEDQKTFIEAGIDTYVPKPVEIVRLLVALEKAYDAKMTNAGSTQPPPPQYGSATDIIDLDELYKRLGPVAEKLLEKVVPVYIREMPAREASLRAALKAGEVEAFGRICHGLKGSSRSLGVETLADAFADLETRSYEGQLPSEKTLNKVLSLAATVISGLNQQFSPTKH